ncbi:hypothetical protein [Bradyrhizobium sp.]|uniref:hypothetical protein n=1 Tax=Bradyrhizobium sp. TaxID=376 RepID=UPI0025BFE300|nr:hypothetical protein [Bradyrhizobium sp.]
MTIELLTYRALGDRLSVSPEAARSLARRRRLPRSRSADGKALVSVDLAEIRHAPQPPGSRRVDKIAVLAAQVEALEARLEANAAAHRADFERERERADRLMNELREASAATRAATEAMAWLEREVTALRTAGRTVGDGPAGRRVGHLAATLVEADRKAAARG